MSKPALVRGSPLFVLAAIIILALNLRTAPASLGVLLSVLRADFGFTTSVGGVLTTLPLVCFALFGSTAIRMVSVVGLHRTTLASMVVMVIGLVLRAYAQHTGVLIVSSIIALSGAAVSNVLLPPLVKLHFPGHVGLVSSIYTTGVLVGATLGSIASVPVADALGSWRAGFGLWAVTAAVAIIPWLFLLGHDTRNVPDGEAPTVIGISRSIRNPLAWAMGIFFALQSAQAYVAFGWMPEILVDHGLSEASAANMLGIAASMGIPVSLSMSFLLRTVGGRVLIWTFGSFQLVGWLGLQYATDIAPWIWAIVLGLGGGAFPWVLTMIGLKSRTVAGAGALSGFTQTLGYLLAATGPLGVGVLHDVTGNWEVPLLVMASLSVPLVAMGLYILKAPHFEDA